MYSFTTLNSTLHTASQIQKKRNGLIEKMNTLLQMEWPEDATFKTIFTGMHYILDFSEGHFLEFKDIALKWIDMIKIVVRKCTTPELLQLLDAYVPCFTQYFAALVNLNANSNEIISFRYEIFQIWQAIFRFISPEMRRKSADIASMRHIIEVIFTTGHYKTQMAGIKLFSKYIHNYGEGLNELLDKIMSGEKLKTIRDMFLRIDYNNFDLECRMILNCFNMGISGEVPVYSIIAKSIICEHYEIKKPSHDGKDLDLWVDFNSAMRSASFFCHSATFDAHDIKYWLSIEAKIAKLKWIDPIHLLMLIDGPICCSRDDIQNNFLKSSKEILLIFDVSSVAVLKNSGIVEWFNSPNIGSINDVFAGFGKRKVKHMSTYNHFKNMDRADQAIAESLPTKSGIETSDTLSHTSAEHDKGHSRLQISCAVEESEIESARIQVDKLSMSISKKCLAAEVPKMDEVLCPPKNSKQNFTTFRDESLECGQSVGLEKGQFGRNISTKNNSMENLPPPQSSLVTVNKPKRKLFTIDVKSVSSHNSRDTQIQKNKYIEARRKLEFNKDAAKLINLVKPLLCDSLEEECNEIREERRAEITTNPLMITTNRNVQRNKATPTFSSHERQLMERNMQKINARVAKTNPRFLKPTEQPFYNDVYDPRNIRDPSPIRKIQHKKISSMPKKKHIVPKFMGENKTANFSYRRNKTTEGDRFDSVVTANMIECQISSTNKMGEKNQNNSNRNEYENQLNTKGEQNLKAVDTDIAVPVQKVQKSLIKSNNPKEKNDVPKTKAVRIKKQQIIESQKLASFNKTQIETLEKNNENIISPITNNANECEMETNEIENKSPEIIDRSLNHKEKDNQKSVNYYKDSICATQGTLQQTEAHNNTNMASHIGETQIEEQTNSIDVENEEIVRPANKTIPELTKNIVRSAKTNLCPNKIEENYEANLTTLKRKDKGNNEWILERYFQNLLDDTQSKLSYTENGEKENIHTAGPDQSGQNQDDTTSEEANILLRDDRNDNRCLTHAANSNLSQNQSEHNEEDVTNLTVTFNMNPAIYRKRIMHNDEYALEVLSTKKVRSNSNQSQNTIEGLDIANEAFIGNLFSKYQCALSDLLLNNANVITPNINCVEILKSAKDGLQHQMRKNDRYNKKCKNSLKIIEDLTDKFLIEHENLDKYLRNSAHCSNEINFKLEEIVAKYESQKRVAIYSYERITDNFSKTCTEVLSNMWQTEIQKSAQDIYQRIMNHSNFDI